ncbi:HAD hydrolase family protein [bacterium]|nr:HAD hydrolase family protein [bacterium]
MDEKIKKIKLILMDVDGVLTDGDIIHGTDGIELKKFNAQDGAGVTMARLAGLKVGILTGRTSAAVKTRSAELKFDVVSQGHFTKIGEYERICRELGLADTEVAYMGDDILDLDVLRRVGFSVAPANARPEVKAEVDWVTASSGGCGAVREWIDRILKTQQKWELVVKRMLGHG